MIGEGDSVLLVHEKKSFFIRMSERDFHTHKGVVNLGSLIGKEYGTTVFSHTGERFIALKPSFTDFIQKMRRMPQVIQPKDAAQILAYTGISRGDTVVEGGAGSGALTVFLGSVVDPGRVYSYEVREDFLEVARKNVEQFGMKNVEFRLKDIYEGIDERDVDLVTLDVSSPEKAVGVGYGALKWGGYIFSYSPCIEQVTRFCLAAGELKMQVKTAECLVREYEVSEKGTRPKTRMLGHTGYMSFARKV